MDPILLVRKGRCSRRQDTLSCLGTRQLRGEQLGASSCQPAPPHHTPVIHQHPSLCSYRVGCSRCRRAVSHRGDFTWWLEKACVPAHALLSFQKLPNHTHWSLFAFTVRHQATGVFLGPVPMAFGRLALGGPLCRLHLCTVAGPPPLPDVWPSPLWAHQLQR